MYSTYFEGKDFWIFQKIRVYFMRASLWVPCWTNPGLIKVEPLWCLPLTYLPSLEVASSDSLTCTKWSTPNKDHIILYQSLGSLYRFYPIRYFFLRILCHSPFMFCFIIFIVVVFLFLFSFSFLFSIYSIQFRFSICLLWMTWCALLYSNFVLFYSNFV